MLAAVEKLEATLLRIEYKLGRLTMKKRASEDSFNELHNLVTKEFLSRLKSGEATTQDLKAACDWLAKNDISGVAVEGSSLERLAGIIPTLNPDLVQERLYGVKN